MEVAWDDFGPSTEPDRSREVSGLATSGHSAYPTCGPSLVTKRPPLLGKGGSTQLYGLKSHDWHKILQFVLPITISGYGDTKVKAAIFKVGEIVRFVSSKEINVEAIPVAHQLVVEAVCVIEDAFPHTILVSQIHLLLHLVEEITICGVVHSRWMFFLERFLKTLKDFVRLRSQPEASMAEVEWIHNAMTNAKAQGEQISPKEWEYVRGCLRKGLIFNYIWSESRHFRTRKIDEHRTTNDCGVMGNFDTTTDEVFYVPCIYQRRLWHAQLRSVAGSLASELGFVNGDDVEVRHFDDNVPDMEASNASLNVEEGFQEGIDLRSENTTRAVNEGENTLVITYQKIFYQGEAFKVGDHVTIKQDNGDIDALPVGH
ncbi:hypothetical protein GOP47_0025831 [Adiantum capillus-veneris]|uniref:DUF4218 domain-containing protein n=1 Tax=Adiantum capillus-veneris TaxID=13818 RepID=A0A9D4Z3X0_ADICA|nr:hypothetical protein GOP47_0025831 [Adiantum capillus-veneris]